MAALTDATRSLLLLLLVVLAAILAAAPLRMAQDMPAFPWQGTGVDTCCKQSHEYHRGDTADPLGFFAPHEEDDPGFQCLMHGNQSC